VNSVNSGDIEKMALVIECGHCPGARVIWLDSNDPEKHPPEMMFFNFPRNGRMMMSRQTIILTCYRCRKHLEVIQNEYGKTLTL